MTNTLAFGSLFTGIGGMDLGLERAGMTCKWQVEIDSFCNRVLAKHWPDVRRYEDVRECGAHNLETVDLICGGFPCQPHSVAGKRRGAEDDRNLWPEYLRVVTELRPCWVVGENVPGLKTTMLDQVLSDLDGAGYTTATLNLPAVAFDAPHRRERLFIIAYTKSKRKHGVSKNDTPTRAVYIGQNESDSSSKAMAHAEEPRLSDGGQARIKTCPTEAVGHVAQPGSERCSSSWWTTEPDVGRVAHGIPNRVDRLRALGNAVVPQVAEWIGKQITASESYKK